MERWKLKVWVLLSYPYTVWFYSSNFVLGNPAQAKHDRNFKLIGMIMFLQAYYFL